ncbi:MAG TPA: hypothetical protein VNO34_05450 [Actinomycetota bacterium]|nr:hypothetical protein [Actinomycetota bacterium]
MARVLVGTAEGLGEFGSDGRTVATHLEGRSVTAVAPEAWRELWAVVDGREVWHTATERWFRTGSLEDLEATCVTDTRAGVLVGTTEAHLFRVSGARGLEPVEGFERVERRSSWYTPWGGPPAIRSISEDDQAVYVNVHVGGVVRSRDAGATWEPTLDIGLDVHRVWAGWGMVLAACAEGLAVSEDGGESWELRAQGLHARYCRAVTVCGDTVLLSASGGPRGGRAALYRGAPSGGPFERCRAGLPEWFRGNIDSLCLDAIPDLAAFGTEDGRVFVSDDQGLSWRELASGLGRVQAVLVLP